MTGPPDASETPLLSLWEIVNFFVTQSLRDMVSFFATLRLREIVICLVSFTHNQPNNHIRMNIFEHVHFSKHKKKRRNMTAVVR